MSQIAPDVWTRLGAMPPLGQSLTARMAAPAITDNLLAALDAESRRHLLIPLKLDEDALQDDQSRGVSVTTRELVVPEHGSGRYLDICCNDASGHDAIDLIGGELADGLASKGVSAGRLVVQVLAKWRRFWGQLPRQILSHEEQLGLFAELWFLSVWLVSSLGENRAVNRWRGPFGARHDFEWPGWSIEVKGTTSTRGRIHRVNGLDQLAPPENGNLLFFSLRLREEAGATNTLPGLVAVCRKQFELDLDVLSRFEATLAHAGYSSAHEEEYAKLRLRVVDEGLFRVEQDFPRVTAACFADGVPSGVERVEYEVNLGGCDHLLVAASATAMPVL